MALQQTGRMTTLDAETQAIIKVIVKEQIDLNCKRIKEDAKEIIDHIKSQTSWILNEMTAISIANDKWLVKP